MNDEDIKKKMYDEEIKKALEYCSSDMLSKCVGCKISKNGCQEFLASQALDLINRQQAEIERLKYLLEREEKATESFSKQCYKDGIKEFAERLRKEVANTWFGVYCTGETEEYKEGCLRGLVAKQKHCLCSIKNLLAEMVGGENA